MQSKDFLTFGFMSIKCTGARRTGRKGFSIFAIPIYYSIAFKSNLPESRSFFRSNIRHIVTRHTKLWVAEGK